jgi:hypothetical protein
MLAWHAAISLEGRLALLVRLLAAASTAGSINAAGAAA